MALRSFHSPRSFLAFGLVTLVAGHASLALAQGSSRSLSDRSLEREIERAERVPARRPFLASRLSGTFNALDRASTTSSSSTTPMPSFSYGDPGFLAAPVYAVTPEGSTRRVGGPTATPASVRNQIADRATNSVIPRPAWTDDADEPQLGSRRTRNSRSSRGSDSADSTETLAERTTPQRELPGILDEPVDGDEQPLTPPARGKHPIPPRSANRPSGR